METRRTIAKPFAFLLALLLLLASAPKSYLHDFLADHQDETGCTDFHSRTVLHEKETDCGFDDLVVNTEYSFSSILFSGVALDFSLLLNIEKDENFPQQLSDLKFNKGPPGLVA